MMAAAVAVVVNTKPSKKKPSVCHSCKRPVLWVILERKRTPLDHVEGGGDVAIVPELFDYLEAPDDRRLPEARYISGLSTRYRRHIDNCPDAAKWRDRWKTSAFSTFKGKKTR